MIDYLQNIGSIVFTISIVFVLTFFYTQRSKFKVKRLNKRILYIALFLKLLSSVLFCYYYQSVYKGGDTLHYHKDAAHFSNNLFIDPAEAYFIFVKKDSPKKLSELYKLSNPYSFIGENGDSNKNMVRLTTFFELFSFGNFYGTAILISFFAFTGLWKIYELICKLFPEYKMKLSLIFFIPTILFWTSGILKDSLVFGAICWLVFSTFSFIEKNNDRLWSVFTLLISILLIFWLKPYVLIILIPTLIFWFFAQLIIKIENRLTKLLLLPINFIVVVFISIIVLSTFQNNLGVYGNFENLIEYSSSVKQGFDETVPKGAAKIVNSDIGSIVGIISMIMSVLFRPFIWESWNLISLLSSVENLAILMLTFSTLLALLFYPRTIRILTKNPFLLFSLLFSVTFSIGLGLSISNFGALMRFKSAFLVFYLIPLLLIIQECKKEYKSLDIKKDEN